MKVTLVCTSGITTDILAKKLSKYAAENEFNDTFIACRINFYVDALSHSDIIIIAPQARFIAKSLEEDAGKRNIPVIYLEEQDLVFGNVEHIYEEMNKVRKNDTTQTHQKVLSVKIVMEIFWNALIRCVPMILLGVLSSVLFYGFNITAVEPLIYISVKMLHFYLAFAIGYEYGVFVGSNYISYAALFLLSSTFVLSVDSIRVIDGGLVFIRTGFIPLLDFNVMNYMILLIVSLLTMMIIYIMRNIKIKNHTVGNSIAHNILDMPIRYGAVLVVLLTIRIVYIYCFH